MKIGIVNMQYARRNYGAVLQAAALEWFLRKQTGAEVEHINVLPTRYVPRPGRPVPLWRKLAGGIKRRIKQRLKPNPDASFTDIANPEIFENFRKNWLRRTKVYAFAEDFANEQWTYDTVIVGSDQVWRYAYLRDQVDVFFLAFLPESCRRIAYAASFGLDSWEAMDQPELISKISGYMKNFSAVSVREACGVALAKNVFGVDAEHVLDPTLLAGRKFFQEIIEKENPVFDSTDVVYYDLNPEKSLMGNVPEIAQSLRLSCDNIYFDTPRGRDNTRKYFSSVPQWLGKLSSAKKTIVTDSFHGICFSILFEKDFICIPNDQNGMARMQSLLGQLNLTDRICTTREQLYNMLSNPKPINYIEVESCLEPLRAASGKFLLDAISSGGHK